MPLPLCDSSPICVHQFIVARFKSSRRPLSPASFAPCSSLSAVSSFPGWLDALEYLFKFWKLLCQVNLIRRRIYGRTLTRNWRPLREALILESCEFFLLNLKYDAQTSGATNVLVNIYLLLSRNIYGGFIIYEFTCVILVWDRVGLHQTAGKNRYIKKSTEQTRMTYYSS